MLLPALTRSTGTATYESGKDPAILHEQPASANAVAAALCDIAPRFDAVKPWGRKMVVNISTLRTIAAEGFTLPSAILEAVIGVAGKELVSKKVTDGLTFAHLMFANNHASVSNSTSADVKSTKFKFAPTAKATVYKANCNIITSSCYFKLLAVLGNDVHTLRGSTGELLLESAVANAHNLPDAVVDHLLTHQDGEFIKRHCAATQHQTLPRNSEYDPHPRQPTTQSNEAGTRKHGLLHVALKRTPQWHSVASSKVFSIQVPCSASDVLLNDTLKQWFQTKYLCHIEIGTPTIGGKSAIKLVSRHHHHHMMQHATATSSLEAASMQLQQVLGINQHEDVTDVKTTSQTSSLLRIAQALCRKSILQTDAKGHNALHVALMMDTSVSKTDREKLLHHIIEAGGEQAVAARTPAGLSAVALAFAYAKCTPESVLLRLLRIGKADLLRNYAQHVAVADNMPVSVLTIALSKVDVLPPSVVMLLVDVFTRESVASAWPLIQQINKKNQPKEWEMNLKKSAQKPASSGGAKSVGMAQAAARFVAGNSGAKKPVQVQFGSELTPARKPHPRDMFGAGTAATPATPSSNQALVDQLAEMGFNIEGCKKAVLQHPTDVAAAIEWAMAHSNDDAFSTPAADGRVSAGSLTSGGPVDKEDSANVHASKPKENAVDADSTSVFVTVGKLIVKVLDRVKDQIVFNDEEVWQHRNKATLYNPHWTPSSHSWRVSPTSKQFVMATLLCVQRALNVVGPAKIILGFVRWEDMAELITIAAKLHSRLAILNEEPGNDDELVELIERSPMHSMNVATIQELSEEDKLVELIRRGGPDLAALDNLDGNTPLVTALATVRLRPRIVEKLIHFGTGQIACTPMTNVPAPSAVDAAMIRQSPLVIALQREAASDTMVASLVQSAGIERSLIQTSCGRYTPDAVVLNIHRARVTEPTVSCLVDLVEQACGLVPVVCAALANANMYPSVVMTLLGKIPRHDPRCGEILASALANVAHLQLAVLNKVIDVCRAPNGGLLYAHPGNQNALYTGLSLADTIPAECRKELLLGLFAASTSADFAPRHLAECVGGVGARVQVRDAGGWKHGTVVQSSYGFSKDRSSQEGRHGPDLEWAAVNTSSQVHVKWDETSAVQPIRHANAFGHHDPNAPEGFVMTKHAYPLELSDLPILHLALASAENVPDEVICEILKRCEPHAVAAQDAFGKTARCVCWSLCQAALFFFLLQIRVAI